VNHQLYVRTVPHIRHFLIRLFKILITSGVSFDGPHCEGGMKEDDQVYSGGGTGDSGGGLGGNGLYG